MYDGIMYLLFLRITVMGIKVFFRAGTLRIVLDMDIGILELILSYIYRYS